MGFTIFALIFGLLVLLCFMLTIYMFLRLVIAVTTGKEVPKWIYNIGQGFQGRIHIDYDDITESAALKAALLFFFFGWSKPPCAMYGCCGWLGSYGWPGL